MDKNIIDSLFREIQSFFSSTTVLIVGSGLSSAEGLPGMGDLAQELIDKVPKDLQEDDELWGDIKKELEKEDANLEAILLNYPPSERLELIIREITQNYIKDKEQAVITSVVSGEQQLRFTSFIKQFNIPSTGLVVICTNYDRLIEIACEIEGIPVDNLFFGKNIALLDEEKSKMSFCEGLKHKGRNRQRIFSKKVLIYKPHGCLNWYWYNDKPIHSSLDLDLERLIITPGGNKYKRGYGTPFDKHREKANAAINEASKFIVIGYGFNDDHLETHLKQRIENDVPTLILTRGLSENTQILIKDKKM